ncbi:MAG: hypothetical protein FH762_07825 [Firmicutes bacterium]|nr:hypothetical protein [Bacillota bacterium]
MGILAKACKEFERIIVENELWKQNVIITARGLSAKEVIGNPERDDFPLQQGKEVMIQAEFNGSYGQAFTDHPGNFQGTLDDIMQLSLDNNYHRALLVAGMNAILRDLGLASRTVHCRDKEPRYCASETAAFIKRELSEIKRIGIIGYQPAIIEECSRIFSPQNLLVSDLDQKRIGRKKYGIEIWDGSKDNEKLINRADLILFTGSTVVNGTIDGILGIISFYLKPYFVFGNTISGIASMLGLPQFCFYGH